MTTGATSPATQVAWYKTITRKQWRALLAAWMGWGLDAMDVMLYSMVIVAVMKELGIDTQTGGMLASVTLLMSAVGGVVFGMVADKIGRIRAMMISMLVYSVFTALCGFAQNLTQLMIFRTILGLGMGGEWVTGAALVNEQWPAEHRAKAQAFVSSGWGFGYAAAAIITGLVMPQWGWRAVFFAGIIPALVAVWIRYNTEESDVWSQHQKEVVKVKSDEPSSLQRLAMVFKKEYLKNTVVVSLLGIFSQFAYWAIVTWIPGYLSMPIEKGGAGLSIVKSSTWVIVMMVGAVLGYVTFGFMADKFGRKKAFGLYFLVSALLVPIYSTTKDPQTLLILGPFIGFFCSGYFSGFGTLLAELYPTEIRATAQGFIYNLGRGLAAFAPYTIGTLALYYGLGGAFMLAAAFFVVSFVLVFFIPETKGKALL